MIRHSLPLALESLAYRQSVEHLLWLIDVAPIFLGGFAYVAGRRRDQVAQFTAQLENRIAERAFELVDANEKFGHACLVAEDGTQAWDMYQNGSVNVVISDRVMPGMDGMELCRRMRATVKAAIAAERVRKRIEALALPRQLQSPPGIVTISADVAALERSDYKATHLWLKRADDALYRAKQAGRNRVRVAEA